MSNSLLRPSDALGFDDPKKPWSLEATIKALGGNVVDYEGKTKCCGFHVDLISEDNAVDMTARRLLDAKANGSDCLVTPCPFCHINLDNYQGLAEKKASQNILLPVFNLSQLVGLAMGMNPKELGLHRHLVPAEKIMK